MSKKPGIRFAQEGDIGELIRLCQLHAEYENAAYSADNKLLPLKQYLFSDTPAFFCLVVEHNNKLIGYATYMKQFSTWDADYYVYMDCLFLMEDSRGLGIGEQLIVKIKEETKKMGCSLIQWQTPDFNKRAMKFYKRIGAYSKSKERYFLNTS